MQVNNAAELARKLRNGTMQSNQLLFVEAGLWSAPDAQALRPRQPLAELCEIMVENPAGAIPIPIGIASGFLVDGASLVLPMATEEPSVVAAASFAAGLSAKHGGIRTRTGENRVAAHIYLEFGNASQLEEAEKNLLAAKPQLEAALAAPLRSMQARGGGLRQLNFYQFAEEIILKIEIDIAVCDALGANLANTCAETLRPLAEKLSGGRALLSILSNAAQQRITQAELRLPLRALRRAGLGGEEAAQRIVRAARLATIDPDRCVTHNKGILNGISALALATANDTRAIEAACHSYAARSGKLQPLSSYSIENDTLCARFEAPLPFATVGGAISVHPAAQAALRLLPETSATALSRYAAALGLAQNLAALAALSAEGIQSGHMRLHAGRLAWQAGARGSEIALIRDRLAATGVLTLAEARKELDNYRQGG